MEDGKTEMKITYIWWINNVDENWEKWSYDAKGKMSYWFDDYLMYCENQSAMKNPNAKLSKTIHF